LSQVATPPAPPVAASRPLCVDLDGTLVKSDTLVDSLLVLARSHPVQLIHLPAKLLQGKAAFKAFVTSQVALDVVHLPYNRKLLQFLQEQKQEGRPIYLATGADTRLAERVAAHLGIFTGVLGSDGAVNLTGTRKLDRLREQLGGGEFDYVGNDTPDLPLFACASEKMVANPSFGLRAGLKRRHLSPSHSFIERDHTLLALLRAVRLHQWAKNLLIFLPLLTSHRLQPVRMAHAVLAFLAFGLAASATYIVNDLLDIETDRRHPKKRLRPFASGDLSAFAGAAIIAVFLALALGSCLLLPHKFSFWLMVYLITTLTYTLYFKRLPLVDVLALSGLYTLRLLVGGAATGIVISHWLAAFSIFLFLSLAFVKRFAELENLRASGNKPKNGRGYLLADMEQLRAFGTASAYAAVLVFALYINGRDVTRLYHHPSRLWFIVPMMILWLSRMWLLASRGELNEDPVLFAVTDRVSLLIGVAVAAAALLAV
jgi:4-hydroxybenzoate polyprenyltransferase/phosphoserine phosphatase